MPEPVGQWWARRQRSKGTAVPYEIGRYRAQWQAFPVLVRQYHPDLNEGVTLSQIPPAAEVFLQWQCDAGHVFVATPAEQRSRPGGARRRSVWCPDCTAAAEPVTPTAPRPIPSRRAARPSKPRRVGSTAEDFAVGEAFWSPRAPRIASAAEADLRQRLGRILDLDLTPNAVRVRRPFFDRLEVWPDIVIPDLKVAIEYDTTGRISTEHVGPREASDRAKDRLLRQAGWEVIRIRTGRLPVLGPFDVEASGVTGLMFDALIDRLREVRGALIVDCYLLR